MNCNIRIVTSIFKKSNFFRNKDPKYHQLVQQQNYFDDVQQESVEAGHIAVQLNDFLSSAQQCSHPIAESSNSDYVGEYDDNMEDEKNVLEDKSDIADPTKKILKGQNFYFQLSDLNLPVEDEYLLGKKLLKFFSFIALVRPAKLFISQGELEYYDCSNENGLNSFNISSSGEISMDSENDLENKSERKEKLNKVRIVEINICSLFILARSFESLDDDLLNILLLITTFQSEFFQVHFTEKELVQSTKQLFSHNEYIYLLFFVLFRSKQNILTITDHSDLDIIEQKLKNEVNDTISVLSQFEFADALYVKNLKSQVLLVFEDGQFLKNLEELLSSVFSYDKLRIQLVDLACENLKIFRERVAKEGLSFDGAEDLTAAQKTAKISELRISLEKLTRQFDLQRTAYSEQLKAKDEVLGNLQLVIDDLKENNLSFESKLLQNQIENAKRINRLREEHNREIKKHKDSYEKDMEMLRVDVFNEGKSVGAKQLSENANAKQNAEIQRLRKENAQLKLEMKSLIHRQEQENGRKYYSSYGAYNKGQYNREMYYNNDYDYHERYFYGRTEGTSDQPISIDDEEGMRQL